jgi:hypothetical protein
MASSYSCTSPPHAPSRSLSLPQALRHPYFRELRDAEKRQVCVYCVLTLHTIHSILGCCDVVCLLCAHPTYHTLYTGVVCVYCVLTLHTIHSILGCCDVVCSPYIPYTLYWGVVMWCGARCGPRGRFFVSN